MAWSFASFFLVSKVEKREKQEVRWEWKRSEKAKLPIIPLVLCATRPRTRYPARAPKTTFSWYVAIKTPGLSWERYSITLG